jgi:hypothetical protein
MDSEIGVRGKGVGNYTEYKEDCIVLQQILVVTV